MIDKPLVDSIVTAMQALNRRVGSLEIDEEVRAYNGDPNGNLSAGEGTLCWDYTNDQLYVNDGTPSSPSTSWTLIGGSGAECCVCAPYTWDPATAKADPGDGEVRVSSSTLSSVTNIYIDDQDNNATDRTHRSGGLAKLRQSRMRPATST